MTNPGASPFLVGEVTMQRVALAMTFVGLMAACIPPGRNSSPQSDGTWSSQPGYQSQPYQSQPQGSAQGDDFGDDDNNDYPTAQSNGAADGTPSPRRGFLGFRAQEPEGGAGVMVVEVLPGSPAASAGLRVGDRIGAVNGAPIGTSLDLNRVLALPPGAVLRFSVRRGSRVHEVAVTIGERPARLSDPIRPTNGPRGGRAAPRPSGSSGSSDSGQWHCRAVGTYARGTSDGGPDYGNKQNIDVTKYGATRDAAGIEAINECSSMLDLETVALPDSGALVLEYCRAISCSR